MRFLITSVIPVIMAGVFFCGSGASCGTPDGQTETVLTDLQNETFSKIHLAVPGKVFLTQTDECTVEIKASENFNDKIETQVKEGVLTISAKETFFSNPKVSMYISLQVLEALTITGSNTVKGEGTFAGEKTHFFIEGSGRVEMDVDNNETEIVINGSGDISLGGQSESQYIKINGSGSIDNYDLITETTDIEINGAGRCKVCVEKAIYESTPKSIFTKV